ncbi:hypothetical protein X798_00436 [Onchocerca flexuosa]|uniref:Smr domain-containing protein n=1 Tax=Onchocerca flexuosa TaxID=387005 RepID=A0A238C5T0_9BILA|nr:hypothetical protein X798_00436 [Onchocerca flexuosa]
MVTYHFALTTTQRSRRLLIITGQGNAIGKTELIKNNLSKWLNDAKIQHIVQYCQQATKKHGGEGAFYLARDFIHKNDL